MNRYWLTAWLIVIALVVTGADGTAPKGRVPCRRGFMFFALRDNQEGGGTLETPGGKKLSVSRQPEFVLTMSDIESAQVSPSEEMTMPGKSEKIVLSESITVVLTPKATEEFSRYLKKSGSNQILIASCDGRTAFGTAEYLLNFDDAIRQGMKGFLTIEEIAKP